MPAEPGWYAVIASAGFDGPGLSGDSYTVELDRLPIIAWEAADYGDAFVVNDDLVNEHPVGRLTCDHAGEIGAEIIPTIASAEAKFREVMARVRETAQTLDDAVSEVDAVESTLQAGERVPSILGGHVAEMLRAIGLAQGEPLTRLPEGLQALAEESGVVTQGEGFGTPIVANLPHPTGPRSMKAIKQAQARRMEQVPDVA